ncbi:MAG: DUF362 domain-containing protein [bacterium]
MGRENGDKGMSRREFEKVLAAGTAAASLPWGKARAEAPEAMVHVAGVKKGSPEDELKNAVKETALSASDFSWLSKGDSVFIKPALNSGNPYPATSSPAGVAAMVELLKDKGAARVVVSDMAGIEHVKLTRDGLKKGSTRKLMEQAGLAEAARSAGAELYFPEEDGWDAFFEDPLAQGSSWKGGVMMPSILKDMDHVVLMPRTSRHVLAGSTLGMKAAVGYWRTDTRLEYHKDASTFQEKTAEANTASTLLEKQRLVLTVATHVQTTFGPDKGHVVNPETGLVIASDSIVAHDMASLAWLIMNRKETPESNKSLTKDPYVSQTAVSVTNRGAVMLLGGALDAARTHKLVRNDLEAVRDDRVLQRAFAIFGGKPAVQLIDVNKNVPAEIIKQMKNTMSL